MCGRYIIEPNDDEIRNIIKEAMQHLGEADSPKTGEIFPTNNAPVLALGESSIKPYVMRWGFPNFRSKGVIINARAETVLEKRTFKDSVLGRRCIIPASGFYEWKETEARHKDKYLFTLPQSKILYIAGFYNSFTEDGKKIDKFVVITTVANESIEDVHDRMPLILEKCHLELWLKKTEFALELLSYVPPELDKTLIT